jgi:cytochrome c oxidase cbb3-type subunit 4
MSLDDAAHAAQTSGLIMLAIGFVIAVIYALWPSNRKKFKNAASAPLQDDDND